MIRSTLTLMIALLALATGAQAQTFSEALAAANAALEANSSIAYSIQYRSYSGAAIVSASSMQVEKLQGTTYTQMDGMESYLFDDTQVVVDHAGQSILLNKGELVEQAATGLDQQLVMLKELEAMAVDVRSRTVDQATRWTLQFANGPFKELQVDVASGSGLFQRLWLVPAESIPNVEATEEAPVTAFEVRVSNYNSSLKALSQPLNEYLEKRNRKHYLQPTYSNYQYAHNYDAQ